MSFSGSAEWSVARAVVNPSQKICSHRLVRQWNWARRGGRTLCPLSVMSGMGLLTVVLLEVALNMCFFFVTKVHCLLFMRLFRGACSTLADLTLWCTMLAPSGGPRSPRLTPRGVRLPPCQDSLCFFRGKVHAHHSTMCVKCFSWHAKKKKKPKKNQFQSSTVFQGLFMSYVASWSGNCALATNTLLWQAMTSAVSGQQSHGGGVCLQEDSVVQRSFSASPALPLSMSCGSICNSSGLVREGYSSIGFGGRSSTSSQKVEVVYHHDCCADDPHTRRRSPGGLEGRPQLVGSVAQAGRRQPPAPTRAPGLRQPRKLIVRINRFLLRMPLIASL